MLSGESRAQLLNVEAVPERSLDSDGGRGSKSGEEPQLTRLLGL